MGLTNARTSLFARRGDMKARWKKQPEGPDMAILSGRKLGMTSWVEGKNTNHPFRTWAKTIRRFTPTHL